VLQEGDVLVAINGVALHGKTHDEVVALLQGSRGTVSLDAEREDFPKEVLDMLNNQVDL
jgi:C-terminal processing protease CtpA/Prc